MKALLLLNAFVPVFFICFDLYFLLLAVRTPNQNDDKITFIVTFEKYFLNSARTVLWNLSSNDLDILVYLKTLLVSHPIHTVTLARGSGAMQVLSKYVAYDYNGEGGRDVWAREKCNSFHRWVLEKNAYFLRMFENLSVRHCPWVIYMHTTRTSEM